MPTEQPLTAAEIAQRLADVPGWVHDGGVLRRTYKTDGWPTTLMLVNAIGFYAEAADHHPDLDIRYNRLRVALTSHDSGGLTKRDLELATSIEAAVDGSS